MPLRIDADKALRFLLRSRHAAVWTEGGKMLPSGPGTSGYFTEGMTVDGGVHA